MTPPSSAPSKARIDLFHAGGREAEIEEVFRRILATGAPLDQVEIACASDAHIALVWEKALRHDWPVTLGAGIPATFTRPGRALIGLCDWIETDFAAGHFRRLLQSGDISVEEQEGFTAGQAARVLARAEAGWGRATYALAFTRLVKSYEARAADADASDDDRAYATGAGGAGEERSRLAHRRWWTPIPAPAKDGTVALQAVVDARTWRSSNIARRAATRWTIGPERRSRNTSASCARSAPSPVRSPKRCASSGSAWSRSRSRPNARGPVISTRAACRSRATPAAPTSSSSASRKGASSPVRPRTRCCSTTSARAISEDLSARPTASTRRCTAC